MDFFSNIFGGSDGLLTAVEKSNFAIDDNAQFTQRYIGDLLLVFDLVDFNLDNIYNSPQIARNGDWGTTKYGISYNLDGQGNIVHLWSAASSGSLEFPFPNSQYHKQILKKAVIAYAALQMS